MFHSVPEIEMNDDINFRLKPTATNKYPRQISTIVFSNALFTIVNEYCNVAGVLRFTMTKKPVQLR